MTNLIKELMALNESAKGTVFQVRIDSARDTEDYSGGRISGGSWEELEFDHFSTLQELADEISDNGHDGKKVFKALPELHAYLEEYHVGTHPLNNDVFDVVDESYDVKSFKDDVLKITYQFTARFGKNKGEADKNANAQKQINRRSSVARDELRHVREKAPVTYRGEITMMPAN